MPGMPGGGGIGGGGAPDGGGGTPIGGGTGGAIPGAFEVTEIMRYR